MGLEADTINYVIGEKRSWAIIKYSGVYNLQEILSMITSWLGKRNYFIMTEEQSEKVSAAGNDLRVIVGGSRRVSWYVQLVIKADVEVLRNIDVLVAKGEEKKKVQQGDIEVHIKAYIEKNYKKTFKESSKFQQVLRKVYDRFIIPGLLRTYRKKLAIEAEDFIEELKRILELNKIRI